MAGMQVVVVASAPDGTIDLADLDAKAAQARGQLGALMVTYPSTHGVFEEGIREICAIVHAHGGQVYMDGANMNAQVGLTPPGRHRRRRLSPEPAQDVLHPARRRRSRAWGRSPCAKHLAPFLPGHPLAPVGSQADRSGVGGAVGLGVDPADLVRVHRDDGRPRA